VPSSFAKRIRARHIAGALSAATYVGLSLWILAHPAEGSWSGFLVFMLGWPLTFLGLPLSDLTGIGGVIAFGTAEWFLIGAALWSVGAYAGRAGLRRFGA
jgi:hypothetical protein